MQRFPTRRQHQRRHGITPEERLHLDVAAFLQVALRPPVFWSTIGHGSRVGIRERTMLKAKGLKPGMPDILVFSPRPAGRTHVLGIELKSKGGSSSDEQRAMAKTLEAAGCDYAVCRTVEAVVATLQLAGIPLHAQVMAGGGVMGVAA